MGMELWECSNFWDCFIVASTVVLLRALDDRDVLETINGHIAVGGCWWLNLAMVLVLVLLPPLAQTLGGNSLDTQQAHQPLWWVLGFTLVKISVFIGLMLWIGRKYFPKLLWNYCTYRFARVIYPLYYYCCNWDYLLGRRSLWGFLCTRAFFSV